MTDCVSLWVGNRLGAVERACMRSVLRQGHRLTLYCYARPDGLSEGVELADASEILPESALFRHRNGSFGPFSDWFRYELQRRGRGTWIDTDVYFLRPLDGERSNLFGEEAPGIINNAVLRLPQDSPILPELLRPFERRSTPAWLPLRAYLPARIKELVTGKADLGRLPWGSTGPAALTALARKYSLASEALPQETFYPVTWERAGWIRNPRLSLEMATSENSVAIHLWNECIRPFKDAPAPAGSFLSRLQEEGR